MALNVMDKDHRFETMINEKTAREKEVRTMSEWLTRVINENQAIGRAEGRAEGLAEGRAEGEMKGAIKALADLVRKNVITLKEAA